jgi:hypothetical protein
VLSRLDLLTATVTGTATVAFVAAIAAVAVAVAVFTGSLARGDEGAVRGVGEGSLVLTRAPLIDATDRRLVAILPTLALVLRVAVVSAVAVMCFLALRRGVMVTAILLLMSTAVLSLLSSPLSTRSMPISLPSANTGITVCTAQFAF